MSASVRSLLAQNNGKIRLLEAHDHNSREIIRQVVGDDGQRFQGVWISGLTQTTSLGIPDTELISPLKRASLMTGFNDSLLQQSNRHLLCAAYDADSGGSTADIPALVTMLASMGISMIVVEDKSVGEPGKKVNSLKETSGLQSQVNMYEFAKAIRAFTSASAHREMMITARIESFTVRTAKKDAAEEKASLQDARRDALKRAEVYRNAGADAIMIHSKSALPDETLSFLAEYRSRDPATPLVVVPTTYSETAESTLFDTGANIIIYANHMMRAKMRALGELLCNGNDDNHNQPATRPNFLAQHADLAACLKARNFGCLLRKLRAAGDLGIEAERYRLAAEKHAAENMGAAAKCLLDGKMAGAADSRVTSVAELLEINARQIFAVEMLADR
ncbi:MAG: hypothetical protein M1840_001814 [Geoglossum simile]|nr:MAG: hypothetical protein M1840_001814 [Geoglossum simile]